MRLEELHLKNFGPYHDVTFRLSNIGAAVVLGTNGAGKSIAFIDAVRAALFGRSRSPMDDMIRTGETDMMVAVTFRLGETSYRVIRKRSIKTKAGKTELELQMQAPESIDWVSISGARVAYTQQKIQELLNCDDELLTSTAFFVQGQADRFTRATPGERKTILAGILRLDRYASLKQQASQRAARLEDQLADRMDRLNALDAQAAELDRLTAEHHSLSLTDAQERDRLQLLEEGRTTLTGRLSDLRAQLNQHDTIKTALGRHYVQRQNLHSREEALSGRHKQLQKSADMKDAIRVAERERSQLQTLQREIDRSKDQLLQRKADLTAELDRQAQWAKEQTRLTAQIEANGQRLEDLHAKRARYLKVRQDEEIIRTAVVTAAKHRESIAEIESELLKHEALDRVADQVIQQATTDLQTLAGMKQHLAMHRATIDAAVNTYRQETVAMADVVSRAKKQIQLLGQVPCGTDLQKKCQFTIEAVATEKRLPELELDLGRRAGTDQDILELLALDEVVAADELAQEIKRLEAKDPDAELRIHRQRKANLVIAREQLVKELTRLKTALQETEPLTSQLPALQLAGRELEALEPELQQISGELAQLAQELEIASMKTVDAKAIERELALIPSTLDGMTRNREEREHRVQELTTMIARATEQQEQAQRDLPGVATELAACIQDREQLDGTIKEQEAQLAAAQQARDEYAKTQELLTSTTNQLTAGQEQLRSLTVRLGALTAQLAAGQRAQAEGQALRDEMERLTTDRRHFTVLAEAYAIIPTLVMENALPVLETETNRLLDTISRTGMRARIDTQKALKSRDGLAETLDIIVRDHVGERPIDNYSGGERFRLDLALRVGLSKLLARRAGARIQTLAIDEGLGSLDNDGLQQLRESLGALSDDFDLILVITHVDEMKATFPSQILVTRDEQTGSRLEVQQ